MAHNSSSSSSNSASGEFVSAETSSYSYCASEDMGPDSPEHSTLPESSVLQKSSQVEHELVKAPVLVEAVHAGGVDTAADATGESGKKQKSKSSPVWGFFSRPVLDGDNLLFSACMFCGRRYSGYIKKDGTSSMLNHIDRCLKIPVEMKKGFGKQTKLAFTSVGDMKSSVLSVWKFDQSVARDKLARMLVVNELPFSHVEGDEFREFVASLCSMFVVPSRTTCTRDVYQLFLKEKLKLKEFFKTGSPRICLTTDTWTSVQQINYLCLTAHFVDADWVLHKKIINFCPITSHKGDDIGKCIEKCLSDWGITSVLTITVDNASSNDTTLLYLKKKMNLSGSGFLESRFMHMRCIAHIINLIVSDGLSLLGKSVEKVRIAVRYIKQSPARLVKFKLCAEQENVTTNSLLCLDVPTRWNSTYLMLKSAIKFETVFDRYEGEDPFFALEMNSKVSRSDGMVLGSLCDDDWVVIKRFMKFLEHFYDLTLKVSGHKYTTSNLILDEIGDTFNVLNDAINCDEFGFSDMAVKMKLKYDKYWGDIEKVNLLIFISRVFDPRHKLDFVKYVINVIYPSNSATLSAMVESALYDMFKEYSALYSVSAAGTSLSQPSQVVGGSDVPKRGVLAAAFKQFKSSNQCNIRSELDKYLKEDLEESESVFDILLWWKQNSPRYPVVSRMARDILAIPISTVSSDSVFSTGGRVLIDYRLSLTPRMVESLVCTQDWIKKSCDTITLDAYLKDIDAVEEDSLGLGGSLMLCCCLGDAGLVTTFGNCCLLVLSFLVCIIAT